MSSESGVELGQLRSLHYAVVLHSGDWRGAAIYRAGLEFNHPLLVRKATTHKGTLPSHWGLVEISAPNVVLTALKPADNGSTILRIYEASGQTTPSLKIKLNTKVAAAHEANLMEDSGRALRGKNNTLEFDL